MEILYYPLMKDNGWNFEVSKILPFLDGVGLDIGCGGRSIKPSDYRLDIDKKNKPDFLFSGDALPLPESSFDYIYGIHAFEHFEDPLETLREWLRVLKKGGILAIVHPDIDHTKKQNPEIDNEGLRENPHNRHYHEHNQASFMTWVRKQKRLGFKIVSYGEALINWSFYVILEKT